MAHLVIENLSVTYWIFVVWLVFLAASAFATGPLDGINVPYDSPESLIRAKAPVVVVLDTEHPEQIKEELTRKPKVPYKCLQLKERVQKIAGLSCLVLHYSQVTRKDLAHPSIKAILISARKKRISKDIDDEFFAFIRETKIPTLGLCGGHQLIVQAYGGKIARMRELGPGENDPNPQYCPGRYKEWGFMKVRVVKDDPLFAGLPDQITVRELHGWEVVELPPEFEVLAANKECKVQAVKHREKALYSYNIGIINRDYYWD